MLTSEINRFYNIINLTERDLRQVGKHPCGAEITVMGLAYKKNDPRESPAIKIIEELANLGADVRVYDPFVPSIATKAGVFRPGASRRRSPARSARCFWWTMICFGGYRWRW